MKPLLIALAAVLLALSAASGQAVRVVAVAPFADDTGDGLLIGASGLNGDLARLLATRSEGRLRVVAADAVAAALRAQGLTPADLFSARKSADLAAAVGADWIVTGRWTHIDLDTLIQENGVIVRSWAHAVLEVRVLEARTGRVLLRDSFTGQAAGGGPAPRLEWVAAQEALRRAAAAILRL